MTSPTEGAAKLLGPAYRAARDLLAGLAVRQ